MQHGTQTAADLLEVSLLLAHGTTMWDAAEQNDTGMLRVMLLSHHDGIDVRDRQLEYTPAMHAAINDNTEALVLLRRHGADLEVRGRNGMTAAFAAAASGSVHALDVLINAGVDLDVEYMDETAIENLGLPCELGGQLGTRIRGRRLAAAKMLVLGGAFIDGGVIVHRPSLDIMRSWVDHELEVEAGFMMFVVGASVGITSDGWPCILCELQTGHLESISSYLGRRTPRQRRRLIRAKWVWDAESGG